MKLPSDKELEQFDRWGVPRPSHEEHGLKPEEIVEKLVPMEATRWWMEGNMLCAESNLGILKQAISTDYICTGVDKKGLPTFKKVV